MKKKITHLRAHTAIQTPGVGDLGFTVPPPNRTLDNLIMTAEREGISVTFSIRGKKHEIVVPYSNINSFYKEEVDSE